MSRARGLVLQNALARYLAAWWPYAESAGAGRNGTDVTGTPGVVWECKSATDFKRDFKPTVWVDQSRRHASNPLATDVMRPVPIVAYFPPGVGAVNAAHALAIMPMHVLMQLLVDGGYADKPRVPDGDGGVIQL